MMSKYEGYTPGPWKLSEDWQDEVVAKCGTVVAICSVAGQRLTDVQIRNNTELIADAPTLLAERDKLRAINAELVETIEKALNDIAVADWDTGYITVIPPELVELSVLLTKAKELDDE